jgi:hypothetical protein
MKTNPLSDAIGKELLHVLRCSDICVLLVFSDKTYCEISCETYCGGYAGLTEDFEFSLADYNWDDLLAAGIVTEDWIAEQKAIKDAEAAVDASRKADDERRLFEKLKEKYSEPS